MQFIWRAVLRRLGAYDEESEADKKDAEVDELGLDVLFVEDKDSVEEGDKDTSSPYHGDYGYHGSGF